MTVGVIIPCFNGAATLARAIRSCTVSDGDIEVLVIDDHSNDESVNVASLEGVEVITLRHRRGQSYTRNLGVKYFADRGVEFIQFLDTDDWLEPAKIDCHLGLLTADPTLDVTWGPLHVIGEGHDTILPQDRDLFSDSEARVCPQTGSMFFRTRILHGDPWPLELKTSYRGGTPYFWQRILRREPNLAYSPEGVAVYTLGNPDSVSRSLPLYYSQDPQWPYP